MDNMRIQLYRSISSLLRAARKVIPEEARKKVFAANMLANFGLDVKIIDASEYLMIMDHFLRRYCALGNKARFVREERKQQRTAHI